MTFPPQSMAASLAAPRTHAGKLRRQARAMHARVAAACGEAALLRSAAERGLQRAMTLCSTIDRTRRSRLAAVRLSSLQPDGGPPASGLPVIAERLVHDARGMSWRIREVDTSGRPGARADRCLIFENHTVVRRQWHVPSDWMRLPAAALLALGQRSPA
jgi:hypothetical protein